MKREDRNPLFLSLTHLWWWTTLGYECAIDTACIFCLFPSPTLDLPLTLAPLLVVLSFHWWILSGGRVGNEHFCDNRLVVVAVVVADCLFVCLLSFCICMSAVTNLFYSFLNTILIHSPWLNAFWIQMHPNELYSASHWQYCLHVFGTGVNLFFRLPFLLFVGQRSAHASWIGSCPEHTQPSHHRFIGLCSLASYHLPPPSLPFSAISLPFSPGHISMQSQSVLYTFISS